MRKKLLGFIQGRLGIFVCIAILFPLLTAVTSSSKYLYAGNSTATVKVLAVGGGGSGGSGVMNAGGGYQENNYFTVVAQAYTVTVGGSNQSSSFSTITANAGGSGGEWRCSWW